MEEVYDKGTVNGVNYKVVFNNEEAVYVFTAGEEEAYFHNVHSLNTFLDRLDSFTWRVCR